jgi:hypothetical protein
MAGVSRSTIWRACKSGRLSAERSGKDFAIEVSELERVFPLRPHKTSQPVAEKPTETASSVAVKPDETALVAELRRQIERLEADKAKLEADKVRMETDMRQERDRMFSLIERQSDQVRLLTDQRQQQRPWWERLLGR